jgi:phenylacetate-coenzyme A ligase PaaK-like adenylate-forming protein
MDADLKRITPLESWITQKIGAPERGLSHDNLGYYQLKQINNILPYVKKNSRYYRDTLHGYPDRVSSFEEFAHFPFTTEDVLRDSPEKLICVSQKDIARVVTFNTSGTTGKSKRCFFTPDDLELTVDFFGVGMSTLVGVGDRVLILLPDKTPNSVGDLLFQGLERFGACPFKHSPVHDLDETLRCICQNQINCLVGVPTQVLALARYQQTKAKEYPVKMKSILLSTDYVPNSISSAIESAWNCPVFNHYGMTEMGLGGGVFCEGRYGYHLREADMYFEIIDPVTGLNLPDGQAGELVFTTLTRKGMPLIRYRTGDITRFLPDPCPCGSTLRSQEKITGRVQQKFQIGGRDYLISDIDEALFPYPGLINYQLSIVHNLQVDELNFKLYTLNQTENSIKEDIAARLNQIGISPPEDVLSCETITGFPEELSSLAKRKVREI